MTITNGYLTQSEALQYTGISDVANTDLLDDVVTSVSRMIDQHCQRHFWQATATARRFETTSTYRLDLGAFNDLVSVTSIKLDRDGDGVFEETVSASDYVLGPGNTLAYPEAHPYRVIDMLNSQYWPIPGGTAGTGRTALTEITGTWGWSAVPAAVKAACRMQVARIFKRQESPLGVAGFGEFGVVRLSQLDPDVVSMLAPYRLLDTGIA